MAAAPASAAAALALINAPTGKLSNAAGFDFGQLVGATNDANCLYFTEDKYGSAHNALFVSAATVSAAAGVLTIARAMQATGIAVYRYVISTKELQALGGPDASAVFTQYAVTPTDVEWVDALRTLITIDPHA